MVLLVPVLSFVSHMHSKPLFAQLYNQMNKESKVVFKSPHLLQRKQNIIRWLIRAWSAVSLWMKQKPLNLYRTSHVCIVPVKECRQENVPSFSDIGWKDVGKTY